ncbi:hypothetical protein DL93DRAFT_2090595 [Clavulina sp. PMI_390]|nr:hypothetical protein DL93DRAFT_2090595 [Clavulina sp. PMI_390]
MTLFSSVYDSLDEMPEASREVRRLAPPLSSLRFHGYCDIRPITLEPYVHALSTIEFATLEFTALDLKVYDMVIETLSRRKPSPIRELVVQSLWDLSELSSVQNVDDYLWPLGCNNNGSGTPDVLPNLQSIIIQNVPSFRKESFISIELTERGLAPRRGTLKRLILPQNLEPTGHLRVNRETKGANFTYLTHLSKDEVLHLSQLGQPELSTSLVEIGFFWEIDNHGLDMFVEYTDEDVTGSAFRFRATL